MPAWPIVRNRRQWLGYSLRRLRLVAGRKKQQQQRGRTTFGDDIGEVTQGDPRIDFAAWKIGFEVRFKDRLSASTYLESIPSFANVFGVGDVLDVGPFTFQTLCAEVGFWF